MAEDTVTYRDAKAEGVSKFSMIVNFMWRRAYFMLKDEIASNQKIMVIDPCAGGGKLLSKGDRGFEMTGYEPDYSQWFYGQNYLSQNNYNANFINDCFESHFADTFSPGFHLAISIPYTDRQINGKYETQSEYLKSGTYASYVMRRSIDILLDGGIGVFCVPKEYVENEKYMDDIAQIMEMADILAVESFEEYAIVVLQKNK